MHLGSPTRVRSLLMPRPDAAATSAPALPGGEAFRLRASNYNILTLRLLTAELAAALPALAEQFRRAPGFLRFAPLVVGLEELGGGEAVDFAALVRGLQALEIVPVGVSGGSKEQRSAAAAAGLPGLRGAGGEAVEGPGGPPAPVSAAPPVIAVPPPPAAGRRTMLVTQPVRAGQRVYAEGGDLVVTAAVNAGAEVIADGHVHVYGPLRGRAVAGAREDTEARIFAQVFDPELVAIAGFYTVRDGLAAALTGRATMVRLEGEDLRFEPLG